MLLHGTNPKTERNKLTWRDILAVSDPLSASSKGPHSIQEQHENAALK